jgi:TRAP-type mannitol/chloroaromatic compound transport system permease small subunit
MEETLDKFSQNLSHFVNRLGKLSTFFIIPLVLITMWDVICRKLVWVQIWLVENLGRIFESTLLQELEWHFHTALFLMVLGYGFTHNRHVRVDFIRENLNFRTKVWVDFLGTTILMIPWICVLIYFSFIYVRESFIINEVSASLVGLSHRWVIKSFLIAGFLLSLLSGIAVWLQTFILLFGSRDYRLNPMTIDLPEVKEENQ